METSIASLADPPADAYDAYLRLHLLSHRLIRPHDANLDGLFGVLNNVAWTSHGPVDPAALPAVQRRFHAAGEPFQVFSVDKFPRMTDYVVPSGVRIADADRVRLGAHLAEGTTVMHEGFVNFNAGTLGSSMVEGRINEEVREPELVLKLHEQVHDLRLDRHVERRDRLVEHHHLRVQRERAGDADALALPAGELVREAVRVLRAQADRAQELLDAAPALARPR